MQQFENLKMKNKYENVMNVGNMENEYTSYSYCKCVKDFPLLNIKVQF